MTDVQHTKSSEVQEECETRYERMDKLGEGTYGIVYKSRDRDTNEVSILLNNSCVDRRFEKD